MYIIFSCILLIKLPYEISSSSELHQNSFIIWKYMNIQENIGLL